MAQLPCENPLCDNTVPAPHHWEQNPKRFCSASCRVATNKTHAERIRLLRKRVDPWSPETAEAERVAIDVYRIARGKSPRTFL